MENNLKKNICINISESLCCTPKTNIANQLQMDKKKIKYVERKYVFHILHSLSQFQKYKHIEQYHLPPESHVYKTLHLSREENTIFINTYGTSPK